MSDENLSTLYYATLTTDGRVKVTGTDDLVDKSRTKPHLGIQPGLEGTPYPSSRIRIVSSSLESVEQAVEQARDYIEEYQDVIESLGLVKSHDLKRMEEENE